ncbi:hypothetical protein BZG36_00313 [Bifiguratus adelaidae]|uniref:Methyltransferase type 11 domain-containing protein n=1 Tax=Bifiguratus adelaidae TaxID=1938954 RepID=A0A261Y820_9FUNG|nr:hypothetical protein BZG36_00313 [Bifiguratus adelaidae]
MGRKDKAKRGKKDRHRGERSNHDDDYGYNDVRESVETLSLSSDEENVHSSASLASQANLHEVYEASVQMPKREVQTLFNIHQELYNDPEDDSRPTAPEILREDFCGTAVLCKEWILRNPLVRKAYGVDLSLLTLKYGREQHLVNPTLAENLQLFHGNVLTIEGVPKADIISALNYGIFYFHERRDLIRYLVRCREGLNEHGVLIVDAFGGTIVPTGNQKRRRLGGFTYIYTQRDFNPLTNRTMVTLSFKFSDGSKLKDAFTYDFRVYSLKEITEAMLEAGFKSTHIWIAEASNDEDEVNEFQEVEKEFPVMESWNAYIAATI